MALCLCTPANLRWCHIIDTDIYCAVPNRRFEENDLPLLNRLRVEMPNDTRIAFYRAQTLWALQRWEEAIKAYDVRLSMANFSNQNPVRTLMRTLEDTAPGPCGGCQPSVVA